MASKRIFLFLLSFSLCIFPVFALDPPQLDGVEDDFFINSDFDDERFLLDEQSLQAAFDTQSDIIADILSDYLDISAQEVPPALDSSVRPFTADSSLGRLDFYLPAGSPSSPFITSPSGVLLNGTSATMYLYCPSYPGYTFQASRFGGFQYRTNQTTQNPWYDLNLRNATGLGGASAGSGLMEYLPIVCLLLCSFSAVACVASHKIKI